MAVKRLSSYECIAKYRDSIYYFMFLPADNILDEEGCLKDVGKIIYDSYDNLYILYISFISPDIKKPECLSDYNHIIYRNNFNMKDILDYLYRRKIEDAVILVPTMINLDFVLFKLCTE